MAFPRPSERSTAKISSALSRHGRGVERSSSVVSKFVGLVVLATVVILMGAHSAVVTKRLELLKGSGRRVGNIGNAAARSGGSATTKKEEEKVGTTKMTSVSGSAAKRLRGDAAPASSDGSNASKKKSEKLGTVVFLAGRRNEITFFNTIDRFCFLLRAIRSFDEHVNQHYGPYPIHVLIAVDHDKDDKNLDAEYTDADKALIRSWAPHSEVIFVNVTLYSDDALSPGITDAVIAKYRENDKTLHRPPVRIGYASMCRLWSFRLQAMDFLSPYRYYMRMDDDSLIISKPAYDPFLKMREKNLQYAWRRNAGDRNGVSELSAIAQPYLTEDSRHSPFAMSAGGNKVVTLRGTSPYNNFHVTEVKFWRTPQWRKLMDEVDKKHVFYSTQLGDATTHAMATLLMKPDAYEAWPDFPYRHNTNDMGKAFHKEEFKQECKQAYMDASIPVPSYEYRD